MKFFILLSLILTSTFSNALELVTEKEIKENLEKTKIFKLSNGVPVIYRSEPTSDIIHVSVSFDWALKDQFTGTKTLPNLLTALMTKGSTKYPQQKLYETIEKYSLGLGCSSMIDTSTCSFETVNDYFDQNISTLSSSISNPVFLEKDFKIMKTRMISNKKAEAEDPDQSVNQAVNKIYYEPSHPYVLPPQSAIAELEKHTISDLKKAHKTMINARRIQIAVVSSMPIDKVKKTLEREFGKLKGWHYSKKMVAYPKGSKDNVSYEERDIPTAYIKIKIPTPSIMSQDAATSQILFEILSEEMAVEIRTKRSLSYSAYAYTGQGQIGLGVFSVSTPKPKETLEVLGAILKKMKTEDVDKDIFEEYKRVFSTGYFLRQETHSSLASTLLRSYYYTKDVKYVFEMPKRLSEVTPKQVKDLANKILSNYKLGMLGKAEQIRKADIKALN
jgi:predicted Zn-dependent peptidase